MTELISVSELFKRWGKVWALKGVSFSFDGGVLGLIGPNGAGKTTLIKILVGLARATAGNARMFGYDCWKQAKYALKKVGVLHEKPRFPSWATGRELLRYVARGDSLGEVERRVDYWLKEVGLDFAADRAVKTYSAGMVQRLGWAQALINEPELVIMDEPTANLDPIGKIEFIEKVAVWRERGMNFLISSHILPELERICDKVVILNEGLVLEKGTVSELKARYQSYNYLVCGRPKEILSDLLSKLKSIDMIEEIDGKYLVAVNDSDKFLQDLMEGVSLRGILIEVLSPISPTLEDIFRACMRGVCVEA